MFRLNVGKIFLRMQIFLHHARVVVSAIVCIQQPGSPSSFLLHRLGCGSLERDLRRLYFHCHELSLDRSGRRSSHHYAFGHLPYATARYRSLLSRHAMAEHWHVASIHIDLLLLEELCDSCQPRVFNSGCGLGLRHLVDRTTSLLLVRGGSKFDGASWAETFESRASCHTSPRSNDRLLSVFVHSLAGTLTNLSLAKSYILFYSLTCPEAASSWNTCNNV